MADTTPEVGGWFAAAPRWIGTLDNCTTVYEWDRTFQATQDEAIKLGFEYFGSDDFNVGQVIDGVVAWFGWMHEEFTDPEDRKEVAQALGFRAPRPALVTPSRTDRQPPTSVAGAKGGYTSVDPGTTNPPDLVTHHEETT